MYENKNAMVEFNININFLTNDRDGRGRFREGDDKILRFKIEE